VAWPKLTACVVPWRRPRRPIIDDRKPHSLLLELFTRPESERW
jgi:hypothetical protein